MGVYHSCGLIVGLPYDEILESGYDQEDLDEKIDYGEIDIGSIYYDSGRDANIVGIWVVEGQTKQVTLDDPEINDIIKSFEETFDLKPKVFVTLNIT